ncbi:hypothetical protein ACVBEF_04125 [Glaciimonas sp. GG7]
MTLAISSTNESLELYIQKINADNETTPAELQEIRDVADDDVADVTNPAIQDTIKAFQVAADEVVSRLKKLALAVRKNKLSDAERVSLEQAVEYQMVYMVIGHKVVIEPLLQSQERSGINKLPKATSL